MPKKKSGVEGNSSMVKKFQLNPDRTISWFGHVDSNELSRIVSALSKFLPGPKDKEFCYLLLDNSGGDAYGAFGLFGFVTTMARLNLIVVGMGTIQSGGVIVLSTGKLRLLSKNCVLWLHEAVFDPSGVDEFTSRELARENKQQEWLNNTYAKILSQSTKGKTSRKQIRNLMKEERYISAKEAVKLGLADGIIGAGGRTRIFDSAKK